MFLGWSQIFNTKNYPDLYHSQGIWNLPHKFHLYLIYNIYNYICWLLDFEPCCIEDASQEILSIQNVLMKNYQLFFPHLSLCNLSRAAVLQHHTSDENPQFFFKFVFVKIIFSLTRTDTWRTNDWDSQSDATFAFQQKLLRTTATTAKKFGVALTHFD